MNFINESPVKFLKKELESCHKIMHSSIKSKYANNLRLYLNKVKGKEFRATLSLLCSSANYQSIEAIKIAAMLEMIHNATLIHDDIIDEASLRRGKPTVIAKYGKNAAILYGDYLIAISYKLANSINIKKIMDIITETITLICEGEMLQNNFSYYFDMTEKEYLKIIEYKTAALFKLSCQLGAILGDFSEKHIFSLSKIGNQIGKAYQIIDDCMDIIISEKKTGKKNMIDINAGKLTLPFIYLKKDLINNDKEMFKQYFKSKDEKLKIKIVEMLKSTNIISKCSIKAMQYLSSAEKELKNFPDFNNKKYIFNIINNLAQKNLVIQ